MKTTLSIWSLSAIVLFTTGCASMMNKGKQSLVINSAPQGATVYENGAEVGRTPYTYTYDKLDGGPVKFELRKEGLEDRVFELKPRSANGLLLVDALLLNIPYYLGDANSPARYSFPEKELVLNMYKVMPTDVQRAELPVVTMVNSARKAQYGKLDAKTLTTGSRALNGLEYPEQSTNSLIMAMRTSYVDARTVRQGTQKGDEAIRRAKVFLRPVLKDLDMHLTTLDERAYGEVNMDMDWEFRSGIDKDSVLFVISKHTVYPVFNEPPTDVLANASKDAGRRLLEEEGLYERLQKVFTLGLSRSKGEAVTLTRPTPIPFSGRKDMLSALVKAVVTVETQEGHGSGFLVSNDGYLITNAHVVRDASTVKVRFQQGFTLDGVVAKVNRDFDVALIKTPGNDLAALAIGNDSTLQLGEELFAIGTPLDEKLGQTVTRGIMSGRREFDGRSYLQTDVSINPGNSGGPLIDETGKVVGVATLKIKEEGVQGIGFGVPIGKALEMLNLSFQ
ncbi:MAG: trypsin-like peptidase domain-containing protein [Flavobacteriales bacterium]